MSVFTIKKGDTHRRLVLSLSNILTTGATSVRFRMRLAAGGSLKVDADGAIEGPQQVSYQWLPADLDTVGDYSLECALVYANGPETVPTSGTISVRVVPILP